MVLYVDIVIHYIPTFYHTITDVVMLERTRSRSISQIRRRKRVKISINQRISIKTNIEEGTIKIPMTKIKVSGNLPNHHHLLNHHHHHHHHPPSRIVSLLILTMVENLLEEASSQGRRSRCIGRSLWKISCLT